MKLILAHTHMYTCMHTGMHTYTYTNTYIQAHLDKYKYRHMHILTHTYAHTYPDTHRHHTYSYRIRKPKNVQDHHRKCDVSISPLDIRVLL